jgi:hypothetical protein
MGANVQQATRQQSRRQGRLSALAVAVALAATSTPALARAPSPTTVPEPDPAAPVESRGWAHVAVDTSSTGEAGPAIRRRVQERADVVLRRAGVMPGRGPQDPTINVIIREKRGDDPGWEYTITVSRSDEPMPKGETTECDLCTETELVDAIEGRLATVAAELEAEQSPTGPGETGDDDEPVTPARPIDPGPTRDPKKLAAKGKAGAALLAVGGGGLVAGIVLAVLPPRDAEGKPTKDVFTDTPGYVLIGVSAGVLIVGAVLLGLDRREAKRQSKLRARMQITPGGLGMRF